MDLVETYQEQLRFVRNPLGRSLLIALLVVLTALPWWAPAFWLSHGTLVWLFAIGIVGQNLLIGYAGQISFGQAGFLAIGAYAFGHLRIAGVLFPLALLAAGIAAGAVGWLVGFPSLRLKGPYLAIATLGFGTAVYQIFANVSVLSGGHAGLALPPLGIPGGMSRDVFLKGLAAAVLGGMNSLPGAVVGGLLLGVAESLTGAYLAIEFKTTMAFVLIVGVLLVRPEGLLGRKFQERV